MPKKVLITVLVIILLGVSSLVGYLYFRTPQEVKTLPLLMVPQTDSVIADGANLSAFLLQDIQVEKISIKNQKATGHFSYKDDQGQLHTLTVPLPPKVFFFRYRNSWADKFDEKTVESTTLPEMVKKGIPATIRFSYISDASNLDKDIYTAFIKKNTGRDEDEIRVSLGNFGSQKISLAEINEILKQKRADFSDRQIIVSVFSIADP